VFLFRYSALTFNAHRIHYDLPYAMGKEGYPGLVVHGPLTAIRLMEACTRHTGALPETFSFRAQAPSPQAPGCMSVAASSPTALMTSGPRDPKGYAAMSAKVMRGEE